MPRREDCIDDILKAAKGRRSRQWAEEELASLDAAAREHAERTGSYEDGMRRASRDKIDREMRDAAIRRRNQRMDMMKSRDLNRFADDVLKKDDLTFATLHGRADQRGVMAAKAPLTGVLTPLFDPKSGRGNRTSAAALALGATKDWLGGAVGDLRRIAAANPEKYAGLDGIFFSRKIEADIFREKYQLDRGNLGEPGITKNEQALAIAKTLAKWDKVKVNALNAEGAWISDYLGWMTTATYDANKIRKASNQRAFRRGWEDADRAAFTADAMKAWDLRRTFGSAEDADKRIAEMYGGFVTGDHMDYTQPSTGDPIYPNVARRVSVSKEIHYKDADAWLAFNTKYGRFGPTETWLHSMQASAKRWGLMKVYGSKPKEGFENHIAYVKNSLRGTPAREELNRWAPDDPSAIMTPLRNRFEVLSGEADRPMASTWAGVVNGVMAVQRISKLGLTPFAMLQDNATISRELARQGLGIWERHNSLLSDYFQGGMDSDKRQVAALLHSGVMERLHGQSARFDIGEVASGRLAGSLAKVEDLFFKITGITPMTANKRAGAERMMARHYGGLRDKGFGELAGDEQRTMQGMGIGAREWDLLRTIEWNTIGGETYLTPDVAHRLPDDAVKAYIAARGLGEAAAQIGLKGDTALERVRSDIAAKLWAYYAERGTFAVIEGGVEEKAILYQGTRPGTPLNNALRLFMQFKQFPTAMVTKAWGAEIYGGRSGLGALTGLTELMVASTLWGALANYLNPLAKGQDPNAVWRNQPLAALVSAFNRGGAGSIYGDLLLGEWSRFGLSATDTLLGPTLGQGNKAFELLTYLTHPSKWKADFGSKFGTLATRTVRENMPFANMIYTKAAVDYLFYYRFMEYLNPGYLARMQQNAKDKQGTEYWLRPTRVQSIGVGPALGEAMGVR